MECAPVFDAAALTDAASTVRLAGADGGAGSVDMPIIGLGGGIFGADAEEAFLTALQAGYRLFDTAPKYGASEAALGRAIVRSGIARQQLFLATKVGNAGYAATLTSFDASLRALQTGHVDLLLMHSAVFQGAGRDPRNPLHAANRRETWRAMVELRDTGRVRAIGVCHVC